MYLITAILSRNKQIFDGPKFSGQTENQAARKAKKFCDEIQKIDPSIQINFKLEKSIWEEIIPSERTIKILLG